MHELSPSVANRIMTTTLEKWTCAPIVLALALALQAGCSTPGDLGRKPESVFDDKIIPAISRGVAKSHNRPVSHYRHTEAEQRLRAAAEQLVTPYGRPAFMERTMRRIERADLIKARADWNSPGRYVARLDREKFKDGENRVRVISAHMRDDRHFLRRFEQAMAEVLRADRSRARHLRVNPDYPIRERRDAETRIEENRAVMARTLAVMDRRVLAYDEALHLTPLRFPGTNMKPARRQLLDLQEYQRLLARRLPPGSVRLAGGPAPL